MWLVCGGRGAVPRGGAWVGREPATGREAGYEFLGDAYTFIEGEVTPGAALGTKVAYFNDPDGTILEIIEPRGGFAT